MEVIFYIFISVLIVIGLLAIYLKYLESKIFKKGRNIYHRICKKCGSHQQMYSFGQSYWWEEIYPIGNDIDCECHNYSEYK